MMDKEKLFESVISNLQRQLPNLSSDKALTDDIMYRLNVPPIKKTNKWIYFVQRCSVAASLLLIGLFLYQTFNPSPNNTAEELLVSNDTYKIELEMNQLFVNQNDIKEKIKVYCNYLSNNIEKNSTLAQFKNINSFDYENNK